MSTITKIGLSKPVVFVFPKENTTPLNIPVAEDLTSKTLKFVVKLTKEPTSPVLILKQTSDMVITSNNVLVTLLNTDTLPLSIPVNKKQQRFYFSIKDISDERVVVWGYIVLIKTVQSDYDSYNPPAPLTTRQFIFTIIDANQPVSADAFAIPKNTFLATVTYSYTASGQYTLVSDLPIFSPDYDFRIEFLPSMSDETYLESRKIWNDYKNCTISIIPFGGGGFVDHDIRGIITEIVV
jgi:hypothetical protein